MSVCFATGEKYVKVGTEVLLVIFVQLLGRICRLLDAMSALIMMGSASCDNRDGRELRCLGGDGIGTTN